MQVTSVCPLRVASFLWQPRVGALALTVVCKATFTLAPGRSSLAPIQEEPLQADLQHGDGLLGSLRLASDLVPFKRRVDVVVTGHAYAPHGPPVTSLVVRVALGAVDKRLEVHGDRWWTADGQLTAPVPFIFMPLRWERAAAGPGTWNPAGVPAGAVPDARGLRPAPNLVLPGEELWSPEQVIAPAGLGPIAPTWLERAARLRRHAATWRHDAWSAAPMPDDIDAAYFNVAPPDQQLDQLHAGEQLVLEHLHREHPQLVTTLDEVVPFAAVERAGAGRQEIRLRCDTMCIEADRGICTLTWRGVVPLRDAGEEGVVVVTADIPAMAEEETTTAVRKMTTRAPEEVLPFVKAEVLPFVPAPEGGGGGKGGGEGMTVGQAAMAFGGGEAAAEPGEDEGTGTLAPRLSMIGTEPLPFQIVRSETAASAAARIGEAAVIPEPTRALHPAAAQRSEDNPEQPCWLSSETVAPPPMIGPLATAEMVKVDPAAGAGMGEAAAAGEAAREDAPINLPLTAYAVERCAAITASIARRPKEREEILEEEKLTPDQWKALQAHWSAEIAAEVGHGKKCLLSAYDAAYVAQLEKERGPIDVDEYARLMVATERGKLDEALAEMTLPRGAMLRIERVWIEKFAKTSRLSVSVRIALDKARQER